MVPFYLILNNCMIDIVKECKNIDSLYFLMFLHILGIFVKFLVDLGAFESFPSNKL